MTMHQDFLRGTDRTQQRAVYITAAIVVVVVTAVCVIAVGIHRHHRNDGLVILRIDTPYVAPGVASGTHVIMHGADIGKVTSLDRVGRTAARLTIALQQPLVGGLTDSFDIDYRPENYFGVTAVNIVGGTGGAPLASDALLHRTPLGDFSMSTMLEKGSLAVNGTLTQGMIHTLDKVVRYTDGLNPMIQTGIVLADQVAKTQRALPITSLTAFDDITAVLPNFTTEATAGVYGLFDTKYNHRADGSLGVDDRFMDNAAAGLGLASNSLFGAAGHLLASHAAELTPVVQAVQAFTDTIPGILAGGSLTPRLQTLVDQYNRAIVPTGRASALQLRIVLDRLPGMAAPLGLITHPQRPNR